MLESRVASRQRPVGPLERNPPGADATRLERRSTQRGGRGDKAPCPTTALDQPRRRDPLALKISRRDASWMGQGFFGAFALPKWGTNLRPTPPVLFQIIVPICPVPAT